MWVVRRIRVVVLAGVLLLVLAGCSESGSDSDGTTASTQSQDDAASDGQSDGSTASGNYATVTFGGTTYEVPADPLNLCNSLDNLIFGSFATDSSGNATQAGGKDVSVQINFGIPVTDWEAEGLQAPTLDVDLQSEATRWFAIVELGKGSVDSWELTDGMATGTATFVGETQGTGETVGTEQGSFEIVCR
jgi:hypothetical protein